MSAYTSISVSRDAAIKFVNQNMNNLSNEELENIVNSISEKSFIRCYIYNYSYGDDDYMLSNNFCFEENALNKNNLKVSRKIRKLDNEEENN